MKQALSTTSPLHALKSETYVVQTMPRTLGTFDMLSTFVLAIFALSSAPTAVSGGPAAYIYWFIGAIFFLIPCAIATTQLGVMFPHEGSLYNWTYHAMGRGWGFFVGLCSWLPGPLVVVGLGDEFVQFLQGLNPNWLVEPWQQGLVILMMVALSMFLSLQRFRMIQNLVNAAFVCGMLATLILAFAGLVWVAGGHPVATNFSQIFDVHVITPGNYSLYGLIMFAYIGANLVLNMGGEIKDARQSIPRHLLWGSVIVFCCYLVATSSILAVQGTKAGFITFAMVGTIDMVFGKTVGNIATILFLSTTILAATIYNYAYARILMAGAIDQFLPARVGKLNKDRVPANAVVFQFWIAVVFTLLVFILVPYLSQSTNPGDISAEFYYVSQAIATLIWVFSIMFLFINLIFLYRKDRAAFQRVRLFHPALLWGSVVVGTIAIIVAIANTLFYSWATQIENQQWWYIVGGLTVVSLALVGTISLLAAGQVNWESLSEETDASS